MVIFGRERRVLRQLPDRPHYPITAPRHHPLLAPRPGEVVDHVSLATSPTPWALQIQRFPSDQALCSLEDYPGIRQLLCEIGHQGPVSRDAHLRLLAKRCGVTVATLQEAARELAQSADAEA